MTLLGAISISGTGVDAAQTWINTTASNLANANDTVPTSTGAYATQTPVFTPLGVPGQVGDGVAVSGVALGDTTGLIEHQPGNPLADTQGDVRVPDVNTAAQMVGLIAAQEAYQANANAISQAKTAYEAALQLGK
jgi:flagellar basal-body rod protein FlgC